MEKLQETRDEWNEDKIKWFDFINKNLRQKNETLAYISHVDETIFEYYQLFRKYLVNLSYQIFTIHQKVRKMVNFHLLFVTA